MGFNGSEFGFKPCPKCGQTKLNISAFSIVPDCIIECVNCGFSIESEISWKDCDSQSEHDKKCVEHLKELWNNETLDSKR